MLLFEKSLIGVYCNRFYDLGEKRVTFSCYGRINANSTGKDLNVRNINTKAGPQNSQIVLPLNRSFFSCQNDHLLGNANNFDYVSPPPYTFKYYKC